MNSYGNKFRISVFGESHGEAIGVVADGVPAGIALKEEDFLYDLSRRKSGGKGTTPRRESDLPNIVSGVFNGYTTGAPVALLFRNENTRSSDYSQFREIPRPGHSDFVAGIKYGGFNDIRGGGHFSGRLTLTLVAAGVLAKKAIDRSDAGKNIKIWRKINCSLILLPMRKRKGITRRRWAILLNSLPGQRRFITGAPFRGF